MPLFINFCTYSSRDYGPYWPTGGTIQKKVRTSNFYAVLNTTLQYNTLYYTTLHYTTPHLILPPFTFFPQRDHYEGTQFDLTKGIQAGPYGDPNRFDSTPVDNLTRTDILQGSYER